ncbi:hypothetical protein ECC02_004801 [Trypanosoma cruzi]|uniref:Endonuclease/exonuclease/phosphatase domain-containing protein n=1 Tax=Trypanosoma cruzi TaxID=5693 RepID=A0A7J6Y7F6_TRYCR|nr:hypothetical protein ECC02_004801 [Trypanosoma cruzi]
MYYREMAKSSPTSVCHISLTNGEDITEASRHCITKPSGLSLFHHRDESTTCASPRAENGCKIATTRQLTLIERRERKHYSTSFPSLSAETLLDESRDAVAGDAAIVSSTLRGWSVRHVGKNMSSSVLDGKVKIVSYNILAQRLVSTELYPHCPMFALAEDYRCSLLKRELADAAPDIIALQEISVDVFEKPGLLGDWLSSNYCFAGDHVVVTDVKGRPRYERDEPLKKKYDVHVFKETDVSSQRRGGEHASWVTSPPPETDGPLQKRSEMEGVCVLYLKDRFDSCEVVPIRFNEIAAADKHLTQRERRSLQVGSHNVALISVLRDRVMPNMIYVIGTVHLIWQRTECQLWQMHHVLREMEQLKQKYEKISTGGKDEPALVSLVLAGDFNSDAGSPPIRYALSGTPPPGSDVMNYWKLPEEENSSGCEEAGSPPLSPSDTTSEAAGVRHIGSKRRRYRITDTVGHSISFTDSYATYREQHPWHVSTVNPSSNGEGGVLDHILVEEKHVVCTSVMRLSGRTELPTKDYPSDHYPVGVIILPRSSLK